MLEQEEIKREFSTILNLKGKDSELYKLPNWSNEPLDFFESRNMKGDSNLIHVPKEKDGTLHSTFAAFGHTRLGQSKAAFISKLSIVIEEADEAEFWLEFIVDEKLLVKEKVLPLQSEAHELASIFIKSRKTAQRNLEQ